MISEWAEEHGWEILFLDPPEIFDKCIVGIVSGKGQDPAVIYDEDEVIEALVRSSDGLDYEGAQEYFDFNVAGGYYGPATWRFLTRTKLLGG